MENCKQTTGCGIEIRKGDKGDSKSHEFGVNNKTKIAVTKSSINSDTNSIGASG